MDGKERGAVDRVSGAAGKVVRGAKAVRHRHTAGWGTEGGGR